METTEPVGWREAFCEWRARVSVNFGGLAVRAFLASFAYVSLHAAPHKALCDCLLGGSNPRVRETVNLVEHMASPGSG